MDDTVVVEVLKSQHELVGELLDPLLAEVEISGLEVVEKVGPLHVVEHDVVILAVLEDVNQVDDVWVLAHFQHFNFAPLLENFNMRHVFFFTCLIATYYPVFL